MKRASTALVRSRAGAVAALLTLLVAPTAAGGAEPAIFLEVSTEVGIDFIHRNGMSGEFYLPEITGAGCGLFDFDSDGDLDLYLVQGAERLGPGAESALTDRLLRNELIGPGGKPGRLRFVDVTEAAGIVANGYGFGVAVADYDDDGWPDLYLTNLGSNQLWRNRGDGTFAEVTRESGTDDRRWSVPAVFFDFDRDGRLDLYIGNYLDFRYEIHKTCRTAAGARDYCGPNAYAPLGGRLLRNRGDGRFDDVSERSGIGGAAGKALGAVAADLNGDGWLDLYVGNDGIANQMWINLQDRTFVDQALIAGTAFDAEGRAEASMGVDAADVDNDGDLDLFMTHLQGETDTLYRNDGDGLFTDTTVDAGLSRPSWGRTSWGTRLFDYDHDGWLDLLVVSGAVRTLEEQARKGDPFPFHEPNRLYRNRGGGSFELVETDTGDPLARSEVSRGAAFGDVDNDGDTDVLILNNNGPARLLLNGLTKENHWLGLRLLGGRGPRDMIGAWVGVLRAGHPTLWRLVTTGGSFASAHDPRLLFGLGRETTAPRVEVHWPDGSVELFTGLDIDRYTTLRQGTGTPRSQDDGDE